MSLKRLLEEEAQLDELYYSKAPTEEPEVGTPVPVAEEFTMEEPTEPELNADEPEEVTTPEVVEETVEPEKPKQRTSWKKRYTTFKASADQTIYQLRRENAMIREQMVELKQSMKDLQGQLDSTKPSAFDGVITQEDEDVIGPDAVKIMKKTTEAVSKPLQEKLKKLEEEKLAREAQDAEDAKAEADRTFRAKLEGLVDNFNEIDQDSKFKDYLEAIDPQYGVPRKEFFSRAVAIGDFVRTADFYNEYAKTLPKSKEEILSKKVTPQGGNATPNPEVANRKPTYTIQEYNEAHAALNKGSFRNAKEKKQLYKKIALMDQAFVEGRMI